MNLYTYCHNNPVSGTDSTGHFLDTLLDIASLAYDIYSFAKDPTPSGALDVALDIVGLAAPGIPSAGLKAGAHLAGAAYKAAGATHGLSKAVGVVAAVSKNGDTALKLTDTVKDAKKASKIAHSGSIKLSSNALSQGKRIPNPNGKKGCKAHQSVIEEIGDDIKSRGLIPKFEYKYNTPNGSKKTRYADVVGLDRKGRVAEVHQVGKTTKRYNAPISRERSAIRDIRHADNYNGARIKFHSYNRR